MEKKGKKVLSKKGGEKLQERKISPEGTEDIAKGEARDVLKDFLKDLSPQREGKKNSEEKKSAYSAGEHPKNRKKS